MTLSPVADKLKVNGIMISDLMMKQRFRELVEEDRDIMDEAEITLEEIMDARDFLKLKIKDFDNL